MSIGSLNMPAIPAYQTVNVVQKITLPANVPVLLGSTTGNTAFTLSMIQDADYVTNSAYPHLPEVGLGYDLVNMTISPSANPTAPPALPDLAASSVLLSSNSLSWGETFQVTTTLQNLGSGDAGAFHVRFLLIGQNGQLNSGIFLGDAQIPGLAAGYNQPLIQTLQLPTRVPAGMNLNSVGYAKIAVVVDAEDSVNESLISNNLGESAPMTVQASGHERNQRRADRVAAAGVLPSLKAQPAPKVKPHPKRAAARAQRAAASPPKNLHRKPPKKEPALVRQITELPTKAKNLIKKYL